MVTVKYTLYCKSSPIIYDSRVEIRLREKAEIEVKIFETKMYLGDIQRFNFNIKSKN